MDLNLAQARVLGCLIEKAATTPDNYPLTTNSLVSACNQKSSRDPIMSLNDRDVEAAMLAIRQLGLARTLTGSGRTVKHRHVAGEELDLDPGELALLSVLLLRGPQTPGELRTRSERQHEFASLIDVDTALVGLADRSTALVMQLEREPGHKEQRWMHLLLDEDLEAPRTLPELDSAEADPVTTSEPVTSELDDLRAEVTSLRARVDHLYELLGEQ